MSVAALRQLVRDLRHLSVPWDVATGVFDATRLSEMARQVWRALPNCAELHEDSFGALVSLCFNRHPRFFIKPGGRYRETRQIHAAMGSRVRPDTGPPADYVPGLGGGPGFSGGRRGTASAAAC
jgi:hypothetical protein